MIIGEYYNQFIQKNSRNLHSLLRAMVFTAHNKMNVRKVGFWEGTATELLELLVAMDHWIRTKPNGLARVLNAEKQKLREKYNIEYRKGRGDNEKLIILIDLEKEMNQTKCSM